MPTSNRPPLAKHNTTGTEIHLPNGAPRLATVAEVLAYLRWAWRAWSAGGGGKKAGWGRRDGTRFPPTAAARGPLAALPDLPPSAPPQPRAARRNRAQAQPGALPGRPRRFVAPIPPKPNQTKPNQTTPPQVDFHVRRGARPGRAAAAARAVCDKVRGGRRAADVGAGHPQGREGGGTFKVGRGGNFKVGRGGPCKGRRGGAWHRGWYGGLGPFRGASGPLARAAWDGGALAGWGEGRGTPLPRRALRGRGGRGALGPTLKGAIALAPGMGPTQPRADIAQSNRPPLPLAPPPSALPQPRAIVTKGGVDYSVGPQQFEVEAGCHARKWRASFKVLGGGPFWRYPFLGGGVIGPQSRCSWTALTKP